jgi:hypothetical protein
MSHNLGFLTHANLSGTDSSPQRQRQAPRSRQAASSKIASSSARPFAFQGRFMHDDTVAPRTFRGLLHTPSARRVTEGMSFVLLDVFGSLVRALVLVAMIAGLVIFYLHSRTEGPDQEGKDSTPPMFMLCDR